MRKKFMVLFLMVAMAFSFSSCDNAESGVVVKQPVIVAVEENSSEYLAAYDYATSKGYELVEYATRQAAIIAVENGKADYVIINSDEATNTLLANVALQWVENTGFKIEYCAVICKDNEVLKADINNAINDLKANGTLQKINDAYSKGEGYKSEKASLYKDKITVLCSPNFENLLYTEADGTLAGKELDFIWEICNHLSLEAQISVIKEYDEMFSVLEQGAGDVIISAVEHTPELEADYLLSQAYNQTTFGVYKRK